MHIYQNIECIQSISLSISLSLVAGSFAHKSLIVTNEYAYVTVFNEKISVSKKKEDSLEIFANKNHDTKSLRRLWYDTKRKSSVFVVVSLSQPM